MILVRYVLLISNATVLGLFGFNIVQHPHNYSRGDWWIAVALLGGLALNFGYLMISQPIRSPSRVGRLISLWLDAKEVELKARAKSAQE